MFTWEQDNVLAVWTAHDERVYLRVAKRAARRFGWRMLSSFTVKHGLDELAGVAKSLREAKRHAEKAAKLIGRAP